MRPTLSEEERKEKHRAYMREYAKHHTERKRAYDKQHNQKHKVAKAIKKKRYYTENKEKIQHSMKVYSQSLLGKFNSYKAAATHRKYEFNLTFEEFSSYWQKPCLYCGEEITTIGIDRIDSSLGYETSNIVTCCSVCNRMKNKFTYRTFIDKCHKISELHRRLP